MSLGVSRLLAGWITPPPATATAGTTVSVTASGYVSAPTTMGPPGFLTLWYKSSAGGPWTINILGTSYNGYVTGTVSKTLTAGQWTWDVRSTSAPPSGSSPSGTSVAFATTNVTSASLPPPTIAWYNPNPLPAAGVTYTVQAIGTSSSGNLYSVFVWKDGQPFAFNGVSSPYTSGISDPNSVNDPEGTTHIFEAQATNSDGQQSPRISMTVKVTNNPTFADLESIASYNPSGTQYPWLPCVGNIYADTERLKSVIGSLSNNSAPNKVLQFEDKTYIYNTGDNGGSPVGWKRFEGVSNLTLLGGVNGQTTLNWGKRDASGLPYDPAYYPGYFTGLDTYNPQITDGAKQPTEFFYFNSACSNISVRNINFDTSYTTRIGGEGTHIKLMGTNNEVIGCHLYHATGFAIHVGQDSAANIIRINDNHIINTWADGVHVLNSNNVTIHNNTFNHTGDDAIAITSEGLATTTGGSTPTQVHVDNNLIQNTHWRGILILGATNVELWDNRIIGTASSGIVALRYQGTNSLGQAVAADNNCIDLKRNYVEGTGSVSAHNFNPPFAYAGHGYDLSNIHNLQVDFTPYAGYSYASSAIASGYVGAFITWTDNSYTAGAPYYSPEGSSASHCHATRYITWSGAAFVIGDGAWGVTSDY